MAEVFDSELNGDVQEQSSTASEPLNTNSHDDAVSKKPNRIPFPNEEEEEESKPLNGGVSKNGQKGVCEVVEIAKKEERLDFCGEGEEKGSVKCALKIEVIDDTALIGPAKISEISQRKGKSVVGYAERFDMNANNKRNVVQESGRNGKGIAALDGNSERNGSTKRNLMQESGRNGKRVADFDGNSGRNGNNERNLVQDCDGNGKRIAVSDGNLLRNENDKRNLMQESGVIEKEKESLEKNLLRNENKERFMMQEGDRNGKGIVGNGNNKRNWMQESGGIADFDGKRIAGSDGDLLGNENEKAFMIQQGDGNGKGIVRFGGNLQRNGNDKRNLMQESGGIEKGKESLEKNVIQESEGNKEKRPRRRGKKNDGNKKTNQKEKISSLTFIDTVNMCAEGKMGYSRKEMEAMRFVDVEEQKKKWAEIYCGLGPEITKEYDGLVDSDNQKQKHFHLDFDPRHQFGYQRDPSFCGDGCSSNVDNETRNANSLDPDISLNIHDENSCSIAEEECCGNDDTDEDYDGILKPAFLVTGEPDFDSGPPQDGLEYLRRVRWEASQIPKVKVSRVDKNKLNRQQTAYMPKIPEIAKCPEHLLPLKHWEDAFLAEFSELRLALSQYEGSANKLPGKQPTVPFICEQESTHEHSSTIVESFEELTAGEDSFESSDVSIHDNSNNQPTVSAISESDDALDTLDSSSDRKSVKENRGNYPTMSTILGMDFVARVSMLRKRISSLENVSSLSKDDCLWLFALCAAVDAPLDADTSASFRSLLRKCANLRAQKVELDDEVVMLNILATISGRYFGQSENLRV